MVGMLKRLQREVRQLGGVELIGGTVALIMLVEIRIRPGVVKVIGVQEMILVEAKSKLAIHIAAGEDVGTGGEVGEVEENQIEVVLEEEMVGNKVCLVVKMDQREEVLEVGGIDLSGEVLEVEVDQIEEAFVVEVALIEVVLAVEVVGGVTNMVTGAKETILVSMSPRTGINLATTLMEAEIMSIKTVGTKEVVRAGSGRVGLQLGTS